MLIVNSDHWMADVDIGRSDWNDIWFLLRLDRSGCGSRWLLVLKDWLEDLRNYVGWNVSNVSNFESVNLFSCLWNDCRCDIFIHWSLSDWSVSLSINNNGLD